MLRLHGRFGLELRRLYYLKVILGALLLLACGSGVAAPERVASGAPQLRPIPFDPPPPVEPSIRLAHLVLRSGEGYRPPAGACQETLAFVRRGRVLAVGTGIAAANRPTLLEAGSAARFGPEGDGHLRSAEETPAALLLAFVRGRGSPAADGALPEGCAPEASDEAGPRRISDPEADSLRIGGGALEVRILLDEAGAGARLAAFSRLDAAPSMNVPEHLHEGAAEILYVEEASGQMRLGDVEVDVSGGQAIYIPGDTLHDYRGDGTRRLRAIQLYAPAGPEQRFRSQAESSGEPERELAR